MKSGEKVGNLETIREILSRVQFKEAGSFEYEFITGEMGDGAFVQAQYWEQDIITGEPELQKTRKWYVSFHAVQSEVVFTALKCVLGSVEHRVREHFMYKPTTTDAKPRRIAGPHFDVNSLYEIADKNAHLDYRDKPMRFEGKVPESVVDHMLNVEEPVRTTPLDNLDLGEADMRFGEYKKRDGKINPNNAGLHRISELKRQKERNGKRERV